MYTEIDNEGNDVFLHVEGRNEKDHGHKLAPVGKARLKVKKNEDKTVVTERPRVPLKGSQGPESSCPRNGRR